MYSKLYYKRRNYIKIDYYTVLNVSLDIEKPDINRETLQKKEIKESKRRYHSSKLSMHTSRIQRGFNPPSIVTATAIAVVT